MRRARATAERPSRRRSARRGRSALHGARRRRGGAHPPPAWLGFCLRSGAVHASAGGLGWRARRAPRALRASSSRLPSCVCFALRRRRGTHSACGLCCRPARTACARPAAAADASAARRHGGKASQRRRGRPATRLVVWPQRRRHGRRMPRRRVRAVAPAGGPRRLLPAPLARVAAPRALLRLRAPRVSCVSRARARQIRSSRRALHGSAAAATRASRARASSSARRSSSARARFCARVRPLCSASSAFRFSIAAARPRRPGGAADATERAAGACRAGWERSSRLKIANLAVDDDVSTTAAPRSRSVLRRRGVAALTRRGRRLLPDALAGVSGRVRSCMLPLAPPLALRAARAAEIRAVMQLQERCEPVSGRSRRRRAAAARRLRPSGGMLRWRRCRRSTAPGVGGHGAGERGARSHRWGACKGPLRCRPGAPAAPQTLAEAPQRDKHRAKVPGRRGRECQPSKAGPRARPAHGRRRGEPPSQGARLGARRAARGQLAVRNSHVASGATTRQLNGAYSCTDAPPQRLLAGAGDSSQLQVRLRRAACKSTQLSMSIACLSLRTSDTLRP